MIWSLAADERKNEAGSAEQARKEGMEMKCLYNETRGKEERDLLSSSYLSGDSAERKREKMCIGLFSFSSVSSILLMFSFSASDTA